MATPCNTPMVSTQLPFLNHLPSLTRTSSPPLHSQTSSHLPFLNHPSSPDPPSLNYPPLNHPVPITQTSSQLVKSQCDSHANLLIGETQPRQEPKVGPDHEGLRSGNCVKCRQGLLPHPLHRGSSHPSPTVCLQTVK
jgi:hypothetical protein